MEIILISWKVDLNGLFASLFYSPLFWERFLSIVYLNACCIQIDNMKKLIEIQHSLCLGST